MKAPATIRLFKTSLVALCLLFLHPACKDKYVPKTHYPHTGYLVVEGFIDAGGNASHFSLSNTTTLDSALYLPVSGASISIESDNGENFAVPEISNGQYSSVGLSTMAGVRYRLHILTDQTHEYLSDYSDVHVTPPVDSISWQERNNGVQIYVSTHDGPAGLQYYKWRFDETWKYHAKYFSSLIWDPSAKNNFRYRNDDELLYYCWKSDTSSTILLGSTAKLASNVLSEQPVTFVPYSESFNKLYNRYSIQVYMEGLAEDEYQWYDKLRKNTESLGSIFDAQPSELTGNIHSVNDPTETVIGWVGCRTVTRARIFIGHGDLPSNPFLDDGYDNCSVDTLIFGKDDQQIHDIYSAGNFQLPITFYTAKGALNPTGIIGSETDCVDCRVKGGVLMRPDFWQD